MVKEKNIIRNTPNFFQGMKKFNELLTKRNLNYDDLAIVIEKYGFDNSFIKKLYSYICGYPHVISYLNKYLNWFGPKYDLVDFVKSYRYILESNGILDSRKFMYFKASDKKNDLQDKLIQLLERYFREIHGIYMNYQELLFYYNLYLVGSIKNEGIYEIDILLNDNKKTIELPDFTIPVEDKGKQISFDKLVEKAKNTLSFIDDLNAKINQNKNEKCKDCKFFKNQLAPFDGNLKNTDDQLDVLIINLYASLEDSKNKQIFKDTSVVRQNINLFPKETKWLMLNLIPCSTKGKSEIGKDNEVQEQIKNCSPVVQKVIDKFKPRFYILIGEEVFHQFVPTADFNESIGKLVENKYLPILHPLSMRQPKGQLRGKEAWASIINILFSAVEQPKIKEPEIEIKEPPKVKDNKNQELMLLDVKELSDGTILMIYTDENGNKVYDKKKNIQTSYIKTSDFKDCNIITNEVDCEFNMNKSQKFKLTKLLRDKMSKLKGR